MTEKSGWDIYLEYVPVLNVWYKAIATYAYQLAIFVVIMILFWWISSNYFFGALFYQIILSFLAILPFAYVTKNSEKLRKIYREKYGKLAYQKLEYKYLLYVVPLGSASLYLPALLKTNYYFFNGLIALPSNLITREIFPFFIEIPLAIALIIIGALIRRPSGGFDIDIDSYIYLMFPEKSRKIEGGIYNFIRHPRYLGRFFIVIGLGVFGNNLLAISVAVVNFLSYFLLIRVEDGELVKRFGDSFKQHQRETPALIPKYGKWGKFVRFVFIGEK